MCELKGWSVGAGGCLVWGLLTGAVKTLGAVDLIIKIFGPNDVRHALLLTHVIHWLQGVQAAVRVTDPEVAAELLQAVTELAGRLPGKASLRVACLRLQHTLMGQWRAGEGREIQGSWVLGRHS